MSQTEQPRHRADRSNRKPGEQSHDKGKNNPECTKAANEPDPRHSPGDFKRTGCVRLAVPESDKRGKDEKYTMASSSVVTAERSQYAAFTEGRNTYRRAMTEPMIAWMSRIATGAPCLLVRLNSGGMLPSSATTPRPCAGPISHAASETIPPTVIRRAIGATKPGRPKETKKYWMACITPDARLSLSAGITKAIASVASTVQKKMMIAENAMALG